MFGFSSCELDPGMIQATVWHLQLPGMIPNLTAGGFPVSSARSLAAKALVPSWCECSWSPASPASKYQDMYKYSISMQAICVYDIADYTQ